MSIFRYPYRVPVSDADGDNITDAPTEAVDYICFKRARMKYANSTKQYYGMNVPEQGLEKEYKPDIAYISMPPQLSTAYQAGYSKVDAGLAGISALEAITGSMKTEDLAEIVQGAAKAALPEFTNAGVAGVLNSLGGFMGLRGQMDANTIQALSKGRVFNPFSEQIFQTMGFRTHSFNFKMVSRNPDEAREIYNIIKFIKTGMAPKVGSAAETGGDFDILTGIKKSFVTDEGEVTGKLKDKIKEQEAVKKAADLFDNSSSWGYNKSFFQIPDHFEMKFVRASESDATWYNPANGSSGNSATMHYRMHPSFCTGLSINYTPDNQYTAFKRFDGSMIQVPALQVGLQFVETRLISQADMQNGF